MIKLQENRMPLTNESTMKYPILTIAVAVFLMLMTPFVTSWLALASFLLCIYRMIRYDAKVFIVDYCILIPISALMKVSYGIPLAIYLCLIAGIWYMVKSGVESNGLFALLIVFLNYLLARMQMNIDGFVLLFGQIFSMLVLVPKQNRESSKRAILAFCMSLLISSVYAFVFRKSSGLADITGASSIPILGTNLRRFSGLCADPNYYMSLLIVGIALLLKLKDSGEFQSFLSWVAIGALTVFGIMTYSKTFFLMLILLIGIYVLLQYWQKKLIKGVVFTVLAVVALFLLFTLENSPFATVLNRLTSAKNLSELTTGRTKVFALYWSEISSGWSTLFFGKGLAAEALYRDPHNIYLEMSFYIGITGLVLLFSLYIGVLRSTRKVSAQMPKQNLISKYMVLAVVLIVYLSLQGIFMQIFHAELMLAALSFLIGKNMERTDE